MIIETGRVTHVSNGKATIEIERGTACAKCHAGCACDLGKSLLQVEADDPIGVQTDQYVQMTMHNTSVLRASFVVYVVPLCALVIGVLLGEAFGKVFEIETLLEIVGGFGGLGLALLFVRWYNHIFQQDVKNRPVITKVIG